MATPMTHSATAFAFAPGRLMIRMPRAAAAAASMLSVPLVPCAISSRRGAASMTRFVTRLYERVTRTWQSLTMAASSFSVRTGRSTTSKRGSAFACARSARSISAAMRSRLGMRYCVIRLLRAFRKHRVALIALAVYHFAFFFPTLFMQRVPSPNDVFFNFDPWATVRPTEAQNSLLNDPPTAYFTLMSLVKSDWRAFHWNPYIASGIPGWGSSAAAVLSPFILIPTLALPLAWVWAGIIFLKLNVAFFFAYLWLREERLGKRGAAIGAILFAASGPIAVRWFWQATNATAFYPALLWVALRTARGKRTPLWAVGLIALAYAVAGFPATMAYGAYVAAAYWIAVSFSRATGEVGAKRRVRAVLTTA